MSGRDGDADYHRLEASTTAAEAVRLDREGREGYVAAQLYEKAAEHLSCLVDITGTETLL